MPNFTKFTVEEIVKEIVYTAKRRGGGAGQGFQDTDLGGLTLDNLAEGFPLFKTAFNVFSAMDPSMIQALKLT